MNSSFQYKILSLDLWDTIIRRRCHPDEIKAMTAEYIYMRYGNYIPDKTLRSLPLLNLRVQREKMLGARNRELGYDDEYELHDVINEWLKQAFNDANVITKEMIEDIYQYELNQELKHTSLDSGIINVIKSISYDKLIIISDFYADSIFINQILKKVEFPFPITKSYISCEVRYNKRSSHLFEYVEKDMKVKPQEHLHVGDNAYSDVEVPMKMGISTLHYLPKEEHIKRKKHEQAFDRVSNSAILSYTDFPLNKWDLSIFFMGFISWIGEYCLRNQIRKLYFFTREGEYYKQLYDIWREHSRYGYKLPEPYILEVSRIATFLPSLREVSIKEMMRIWNQYSCQSMAAFFKSVRLDAAIGKSFTDKYNIEFEKELRYPWQLKEIQLLFDDEDFKRWFQGEIDTNKSLILDYCRNKGLELSNRERIGIVDIGWRGTIQDNLCYLFPNAFIEGFYIGTVKFLNEQPKNSGKHGYINFCPKSELLFHTLTPFEMICNSPNGSTVYYYREEDTVKALRKKEKEEEAVYFTYTKAYQEGIKRNLAQLVLWNQKHFIMPEQYHVSAFKTLYHFCCYPDYKCATAYFLLVHNEEFGVGQYVDKRTRLHLGLMILALLSKKKRIEFKEFLIGTSWPQGYLAKYRLFPLLKIYNMFLERYHKT